jgi:hypothetical protein
MKRKNASSWPKWPEIIEFAEECLTHARTRVEQLEAAIRTFRSREAVGDPCPMDLIQAAKKGQKSRK